MFSPRKDTFLCVCECECVYDVFYKEESIRLVLRIQSHVDSGAQVKEKSFPYAFRRKNFLRQQ